MGEWREGDEIGLGLPTNSMVKTIAKRQDGFYVSAAYRFTRWFELGSYYSAHYQDRNDRKGEKLAPAQPTYNGYQKDIDLTLRFDVTDGWTLKAEGHKMIGASQVTYDVLNTEKNWYLFAARASYTF